MSEWRDVPLGGLVRCQSGFAFKSRDWTTAGVPVVKIRDVRSGVVRLDGVSFVAADTAAAAERFLLRRGDVLITMSGEIGSVGVYKHDRSALLNQRVGRLELLDSSAADLTFLSYALQDPTQKRYFESVAYGAAQPNISPSLIGRARVRIPPLATQRRIAAVLSAFDELIEINERRIARLEELVGSRYHEWFVRFRFPGHEDVEFVDSELGPIPEGWRIEPLGAVATLSYGKALPAKKRRPGPVAVVSSAGVVDEHDEALVHGPGLVIGRKGNVGSVWWVDKDFFPIDTTYFVESEQPLGLLYWQLADLEFIDAHAAVPGLSREQAYALPVMRPNAELSRRFGDAHRTVFDLKATLEQRNLQLAATRDQLLPRLVAGRLDISDLTLGDLLPAEAA